MDFGLIHTVWTLILVALFFGIVRWAWSDRRREGFGRAEREPLNDDMDSLPPLTPIPSPEGRGGRAERAGARPR